MEIIKSILRNPLTLWIKWFVCKYYYEIKLLSKHLKIGYMASIMNCDFGNYNTISRDVVLSNVTLGDFSYIGPDSKVANAIIGKFSCIGPEVLAGLGIHPSRDFVSMHPIFYSPRCQSQITFASPPYWEEFAQIKIGSDVWIGARAVIRDGITIGDGAIVGAGAVVVKDVPDYAIVAGVPAKIIRYRFEVNEIEHLNRLKWWDRDMSWLKAHAADFKDIKKLIHDKARD